ncbi:hypothetical protein [Gemmata massiliana]|uniref:hypothetical protein n=1 Tax=Gemmata massiliana TaxID=1210884 RepID=UPI0013A68F22|nr:hypothetical protein [Gemmata massiliana]
MPLLVLFCPHCHTPISLDVVAAGATVYCPCCSLATVVPAISQPQQPLRSHRPLPLRTEPGIARVPAQAATTAFPPPVEIQYVPEREPASRREVVRPRQAPIEIEYEAERESDLCRDHDDEGDFYDPRVERNRKLRREKAKNKAIFKTVLFFSFLVAIFVVIVATRNHVRSIEEQNQKQTSHHSEKSSEKQKSKSR